MTTPNTEIVLLVTSMQNNKTLFAGTQGFIYTARLRSVALTLKSAVSNVWPADHILPANHLLVSFMGFIIRTLCLDLNVMAQEQYIFMFL